MKTRSGNGVDTSTDYRNWIGSCKTAPFDFVIYLDDFRFGAERVGDFDLLRRWGNSSNVLVSNTDTILYDQERISSTRIRKALLDSNFELAEALLGRPYIFSGKVVFGNQLGRTINIPTTIRSVFKCKTSKNSNIKTVSFISSLFGIY